MKNQHFNFLLILNFCVCILFFACENKAPATPKDLLKENLIPKPVSVNATGSSFAITSATEIFVNGNEELKRVGEILANELKPATGFDFPIKNTKEVPAAGNFYFSITKNEKLGDEGYQLNITEDLVHLEANAAAGIYRGIQTIKQLLPASIAKGTAQSGPWEIASGTITDYPNYEYRGAMLDVSRHFFGVEDVKTYIDYIASYKMNVLHLHLTDDQGWRIEIKKWPNLTDMGGTTEVGGTKGGFFTQEDYKAIVKYAMDRHIMVVPEIDMPGHTNAALASYAKLNCDGNARDLYTGTEVGFSTLCTRRELTYEFIDDVIMELVAMTPGPYIHIGGDESHQTREDDYIYFINRVQEIVAKHGKQLMGWDDVVAGKLQPNAVAQHWAKEENAKTAVEKNMKIVMSPAKKAYLDMQYDSTSALGLHWAGYIEIDTGYDWDPATYIKGVGKENILGIECPLWTETVTNMEELEYMVFPRLLGYAEIGWSPDSNRSWDEYKIRLGKQKTRFEAMDLNYYASKLVPWSE